MLGGKGPCEPDCDCTCPGSLAIGDTVVVFYEILRSTVNVFPLERRRWTLDLSARAMCPVGHRLAGEELS